MHKKTTDNDTEPARKYDRRFSKETREIMLSDPNPVARRFNQLCIDYADKFNDRIAVPVGLNQDIEEWIDDVQRCIDNGTPYVYPKSNVPDDALI